MLGDLGRVIQSTGQLLGQNALVLIFAATKSKLQVSVLCVILMPEINLGNAPDPLAKENSKRKKGWVTNEVIFGLASDFYEHMMDTAEWRSRVLVWEGSMSKWFIERNVRHLYSPVTRILYSAGCINLASRGGGTKPSLVHLHRPPTLEEVKSLRENEFFFEKDTLTGKAKERILEQMVSDQRRQIADLTARVERLERGT